MSHEVATAPVFELITAFGESSDARLRSNAIYALAALSRSSDPVVCRRALDELRGILAAAPAGGGSMDWQRLFSERALDALGQLKDQDRLWLRNALAERLADSTDTSQRQSIARLELAAYEPPHPRFDPGGHWRYQQLCWVAGRPSFWSSLWAAGWRSAWVWTPLLTILLATSELSSVVGQALAVWLWTAICMSLLAVASLAGRMTPPRAVQAIDTVLCGLVFGLLVAGLAMLVPETIGSSEIGSRQVVALVLLGIGIGVTVRVLRWIAVLVDLDPQGMATLLRPVTAFLLTTVVCQAITAIAPSRPLATAWLLLAPAAAIAAWLDVWLDRNGPRIQRPEARGRREWLMPVLAAGSAVLVMAFAYLHANLKDMLTEGATRIDLPAAGRGNEPLILTTRLNGLVPIRIETRSTYRFVSGGNTPMDSVLVILNEDRTHRADADPEPPTLTETLDPGLYYVCVARESDRGCLLSGNRGTNRAFLAIAGTLLLALDNVERTVTITPASEDDVKKR